ncbi:MAG: type II 3-dehydroquinate dehydratase [Chitinophagales bacterium]|nr:type II 3-dehydroquinate dehydratase [Chitinophagales bacterium]MDW8427676.1 type II 3-dehydroquinate dehydratase [Chitinophagales bacterium]
MKILIINGPNLNLLGQREPQLYGSQRFEDYVEELRSRFVEHQILYFQSNEEGALINRLHAAQQEVDAVVLNPGGFTHTSVALADAVAAIKLPVIEVHITNPWAREPYRRHSLLEGKCAGTISGIGLAGYELAVELLVEQEGRS